MRNNNFFKPFEIYFYARPIRRYCISLSGVPSSGGRGGGAQIFLAVKTSHSSNLQFVLRHSNVTDETYFCGFRCAIFEGGRLSKKN